MSSKTDKLYRGAVSAPVILIFLICLYVAGYLIGCIYTQIFDVSGQAAGSPFFSAVFITTDNGYLSVFSGFLFDYLFVFLFVFLFGMTCLGVFAVPAAVLFKSLTQGISLSVFLLQNSNAAFFQRWITYIPAAVLSTIILLLFSVRACSTSVHLCRQLLTQNTAEITLRPYLIHFVVSLLAFTVVSGLRCVLGLLAAI